MARRPKILLVDDEPFVIRAVSATLEQGGFDVVSCEQWTGVAGAVRAEAPDLVLLDYNMPTLKGDSLCSALKRSGANPGMRIAIFSSESDVDLSRIAIACGADGFVSKSLTPADLVSRVRSLATPRPATSA